MNVIINVIDINKPIVLIFISFALFVRLHISNCRGYHSDLTDDLFARSCYYLLLSSNMELLPQGQKNTSTEVEWQDQQKINQFSTLINNKDELELELSTLKQELDYFDDLSLEIELLDEDEKIQYKLGDCFIFLSVQSATKRIEAEQTQLKDKIESIDEKMVKIDEKLAELKAALYDKFGNNINLER